MPAVQSKQIKWWRNFENYLKAVVRYDSTVLIGGDRSFRKTTAGIALLRKMAIRSGLILCGSAEWKKTYCKYFPGAFVWNHVDEDRLQELLDFQEDIANRIEDECDELSDQLHKKEVETQEARWAESVEKFEAWTKERGLSNKEVRRCFKLLEEMEEEIVEREIEERNATVDAYRDQESMKHAIYILWDDFGYDPDIMKKSPALRRLVQNGRHALVFPVFLVQHILQFPADLRPGVDVVIMANSDLTEVNRKKIYLQIVGLFKTAAEFSNVFTEVAPTKGHFMVVNKRATTKEEGIFEWHVKRQDRYGKLVGEDIFQDIGCRLFAPDRASEYAKNVGRERIEGKGKNKKKSKKSKKASQDDEITTTTTTSTTTRQEPVRAIDVDDADFPDDVVIAAHAQIEKLNQLRAAASRTLNRRMEIKHEREVAAETTKETQAHA